MSMSDLTGFVSPVQLQAAPTSYFYDPEYEIQILGCDGEKSSSTKSSPAE
jgi:hypothetical protein